MAALATSAAPAMGVPEALPPADGLSRRDFAFDGTFLNAAYTHPMSRRVAAAIAAFTQERRQDPARAWTDDNHRDAALAAFGRLVNVQPQDLAIVPSTTTGENMLVDALGIGPGGGVVTDALHYFGSLALYQAKAAAGMPLSIVRPRGAVVELADIEAAIDSGTRLIAVSLTAGATGFTHDLTALCRMAHARGVLVYADLIQAAGAIPIDLTASGVDFACCGSYKWLMGDFGAAFLYVRRDRLGELAHKAVGWRQVDRHVTHLFPFDPPGGRDDFTFVAGPAGVFEIGTPAHGTLASLARSIPDILNVGVATLAARRRPLIERLQRELPPLGFLPLSPADNRSAIASFALQDAGRRLRPALTAHGVVAQVSTHRIRISPSAYTTDADITRVIVALKQALAR